MTRRLLRGARPVRDRHARRGARTIMTRRPRRGGEGYVMIRRLWGGARTVMPRRTLRDGGSLMTRRLCVPGAGPVVVRRWRHGARTAMTRQPRRGGEGMVMARRHGCGRPTTGGRHDGASDSLPGGARCSRMVLHLPLPTPGHIVGGWGKDNGLGGGWRASPPGPLSTWWRGGAQRGRGQGAHKGRPYRVGSCTPGFLLVREVRPVLHGPLNAGTDCGIFIVKGSPSMTRAKGCSLRQRSSRGGRFSSSGSLRGRSTLWVVILYQ